MSEKSNRPRVVLVDDHPAVLHQVEQLVATHFEVIATLRDGRDLIALAAHEPIDLVVLDITLPAMSGIQIAPLLKESGCSARIVFLTVHADPDYVREGFAAGGSAYVLKPRIASDLLPAIKAALKGAPFISPVVELREVAEELFGHAGKVLGGNGK
jgi:DNA-binding NarL/FixJ family response regulator